MKMSIPTPQTFDETLDLFQSLPGSETTSDGSHFTDDPEQTYLWTVGALSKEENDAVQIHLCHCKYCQSEVADMVESGAITLPTLQVKPTVSPSSSRFTQVHRAILAVCAIGLFGLILGVSFFSGQSDQVARFNPKPVDRDWLIVDTWVEAQTMSIDTPIKPAPSEVEEFDDSLYRNVPESEHSVAYNAAYGQYLLRHGKTAEAKAQFEAALRLNADSVEAALGLGLVAFAKGDFKGALDHFGKLGEYDLSETLQFIVAYNAARAARALEEWDTAKTYWEKAKRLLKEEFASLSEEIEHELNFYE